MASDKKRFILDIFYWIGVFLKNERMKQKIRTHMRVGNHMWLPTK